MLRLEFEPAHSWRLPWSIAKINFHNLGYQGWYLLFVLCMGSILLSTTSSLICWNIPSVSREVAPDKALVYAFSSPTSDGRDLATSSTMFAQASHNNAYTTASWCCKKKGRCDDSLDQAPEGGRSILECSPM